MSSKTVVKAENVSKKFSRHLRHVMLYGAKDIGLNMIGRSARSDLLRDGEFWALDDISFELKKGDVLGLVGINGSGKSTLLKLLSGLYMPDKGRITISESVRALIELGAGFHPMLTGRENIYINGAVMGMSKAEIDRKFDEIVEFADIGEFIDVPVKHYSSGMHARLGFSIAVHTDPEILLIDEVLSVGDAAFQEKSIRRMEALRETTSMIFVSHSFYRVESICNKAIWLDGGRVKKIGGSQEVVRAYLDEQERNVSLAGTMAGQSRSSMPVVIDQVELLDLERNVKDEFAFGEGFIVRVHYNALQRIARPLFNIKIAYRGIGVFGAEMLVDGHGPEFIEGKGTIDCRFNSVSLTPKVYDIVMFTRSRDGLEDIAQMATYKSFRVVESPGSISLDGPMAISHFRTGSPIYVPHEWIY